MTRLHAALLIITLAPVTHAQEPPTSRAFAVGLGGYLALAAADVATSEYAIGRYGAHEMLLGPTASPLAFGAIKGGLAAAVVWGAWRCHRDRPRLAWIILVAASALEAGVVAHNTRVGR